MIESIAHRLTDHCHPAVRYLALTQLGGCDPHEACVQEVRAAIPDVPPARTILDAQYPDGYWMHTGLGISPRYRATVWQVLFLAQLGVGDIDPVVRAVAYLLDANLDRAGAFHLSQGVAGRSAALTGAMLWSLARTNLTEDPRLVRCWSWLGDRWAAGALTPRARVWVLRASAAWGHEDWIARLRSTLKFERLDPLTFPLTHQPDALARVEAWCESGPVAGTAAIPPGLRGIRDALVAKARSEPEEGWSLERVPGKLWFDPGPVGAPNPWVTVRVLRVVRRLNRGRDPT
jgi:hypothetical protein